MKHLSTGTDARGKLISGVNIVADNVKITLGPSGRNVFIRTIGTTEPFTTKDGATIAREVFSRDPIEQVAVECIQMVATQSESQAGDGTTSASILAQAMINDWNEKMQEYENNHGEERFNTVSFKRGMTKAANVIEEHLYKISESIQGDNLYDRLYEIALVSTNNDKELAPVCVDSYMASGDSGIVNIQRSKTDRTHLHTTEGIHMPISFRHPGFMTDGAKGICKFEKPFVLLTNVRIASFRDNLMKILDICMAADKPILIIANEVQDDIMSALVEASVDGNMKVSIAKALDFGTPQRDILEDLSIMLGKPACLEDNGIHWDNWDIPENLEQALSEDGPEAWVEKLKDYLPEVEEITQTNKSTAIKVGKISEKREQEIQARIELIEGIIEEKPSTQEYEINVLKSRKSRLNAGVSYVNIHANSEMEMQEKQHRVEDCLHSLKWAAKSGIVPGGGSELLRIKHGLSFADKPMDKFEKMGAESVFNSLDAVFFQILKNAGITLDSKDIETLKNTKDYGVNARRAVLCNMKSEGIIDSTHIVVRAVQNAATIAGDIITTDVVIVDDEHYRERKSLL